MNLALQSNKVNITLMIGINNAPRNTALSQRAQATPGSKVTRYDLINKNYIFPQEKFTIQSSYNAYYYDNSKDRVRTEKASYPMNQVLPTGKFQANSSYINDFVNTQSVRRHLIRHEGQLKIGGKFEGQSSYLQSYSNQGSAARQEKITFAQNKIMPQGKFQAASTYAQNYQKNISQFVPKMKPKGELKVVGGPLEGQSTYVLDFYNKEAPSRNQNIKFSENQILPKGHFEGNSTYGEAYVDKQTGKKAELIKHKGQLSIGGQFYGESSYSQNYFDKGLPSRQEKFQLKNNLLIPEGKLQEDTTYGANYLKTPIPKVQKFKPQGELKIAGGPLQGQSCYESEYVKKEILAKKDRQKICYQKNEILPKGKFIGNSTYENTYLGTSAQKNVEVRPQDNLNVANTRFEGSSSYEIDFDSAVEGPRYLNKQNDYLSLKK